VELEGFAAEMIDRFGKLPKEVNTLLLVMRIKAMCRRAGISRLDAGPKGATVQFHQDRFADPAALIAWIKAQGQGVRVTGPKIVFAANWTTEGDRIKGAFAIARDLAALLKARGP
jgi:transcription-repair coupling factor (superfamily II helicase)